MLQPDYRYPDEKYDDTFITFNHVAILNSGVVVEVVPRNMRRVALFIWANTSLSWMSPVPGSLLLTDELGQPLGIPVGTIFTGWVTKHLYGDAARCAWYGFVPSGQDVLHFVEILHK